MIAEHRALLAIAGGLGLKTYTVHPHAGFDPPGAMTSSCIA